MRGERNDKIHLSEEQEKEFIRLYNENYTLNQIALKLGFGDYVIHKHKQKYVMQGKIINQTRGKAKVFTLSEDERLLDARRNGKTWVEVGKELNISGGLARKRYLQLTDLDYKRNKGPKKLWEVEAEARKRGMSYGQYVGGDGDSRI